MFRSPAVAIAAGLKNTGGFRRAVFYQNPATGGTEAELESTASEHIIRLLDIKLNAR
jgi:hypothetical protein